MSSDDFSFVFEGGGETEGGWDHLRMYTWKPGEGWHNTASGTLATN